MKLCILNDQTLFVPLFVLLLFFLLRIYAYWHMYYYIYIYIEFRPLILQFNQLCFCSSCTIVCSRFQRIEFICFFSNNPTDMSKAFQLIKNSCFISGPQIYREEHSLCVITIIIKFITLRSLTVFCFNNCNTVHFVHNSAQ